MADLHPRPGRGYARWADLVEPAERPVRVACADAVVPDWALGLLDDERDLPDAAWHALAPALVDPREGRRA